MISAGINAAILDKDALAIRNNVLPSASLNNFGSLNSAWKELNRSLYLTSSKPKWATVVGSSSLFQVAFSESIAAQKKIPALGNTGSTVTAGGAAYATTAYASAVLLPDGKVFPIPYGATGARYYDPVLNTTVGLTGSYPGSNAYLGGVLMADGRVFCIPHNATAGRIYDHANLTSSFVSGTFPGTNAYAGGVLLPDGKVFLNPCSQTRPRLYDPINNTGSIETVGQAYSGSLG